MKRVNEVNGLNVAGRHHRTPAPRTPAPPHYIFPHAHHHLRLLRLESWRRSAVRRLRTRVRRAARAHRSARGLRWREHGVDGRARRGRPLGARRDHRRHAAASRRAGGGASRPHSPPHRVVDARAQGNARRDGRRVRRAARRARHARGVHRDLDVGAARPASEAVRAAERRPATTRRCSTSSTMRSRRASCARSIARWSTSRRIRRRCSTRWSTRRRRRFRSTSIAPRPERSATAGASSLPRGRRDRARGSRRR